MKRRNEVPAILFYSVISALVAFTTGLTLWLVKDQPTIWSKFLEIIFFASLVLMVVCVVFSYRYRTKPSNDSGN
jgi:ABC-type transport system involved in cytochrome c biogenesis permease subunit